MDVGVFVNNIFHEFIEKIEMWSVNIHEGWETLF